jgi:hypothetical protein
MVPLVSRSPRDREENANTRIVVADAGGIAVHFATPPYISFMAIQPCLTRFF